MDLVVGIVMVEVVEVTQERVRAKMMGVQALQKIGHCHYHGTRGSKTNFSVRKLVKVN